MNLSIFLRPGSAEAARELADELNSVEGEIAATVEGEVSMEGIDPLSVMLLVAIASIEVGVFTRVVDWIRRRNECLVVIDARGAEVKILERCDVDAMRGERVIVTDEGTQLRISRTPQPVDVDRLLELITGRTVDAALEYAQNAGLAAVVEEAGKGFS